MSPTAMEELSDLVCGTSRCAVSESMGQHAYLYGLDQLDALAWQWMDQHANLLEQV